MALINRSSFYEIVDEWFKLELEDVEVKTFQSMAFLFDAIPKQICECIRNWTTKKKLLKENEYSDTSSKTTEYGMLWLITADRSLVIFHDLQMIFGCFVIDLLWVALETINQKDNIYKYIYIMARKLYLLENVIIKKMTFFRLPFPEEERAWKTRRDRNLVAKWSWLLLSVKFNWTLHNFKS